MRIKEILDYDNNIDIIDVLKNKDIPKLDKQYDYIKTISNDFSIPGDWISYDIFQEMKHEFNEIYPSIIKSFPEKDDRWNIKIHELKTYFGT